MYPPQIDLPGKAEAVERLRIIFSQNLVDLGVFFPTSMELADLYKITRFYCILLPYSCWALSMEAHKKDILACK